MLPERYCHLLSAYLDGELSKRGRQSAVRLLRKSRQARAFFRALRQDAQRLRSLPPPTVPDLAPHVLRAIAERGLQPAAAAAATAAPASFPTWLGAALAASILAAVTAGSFFFFSRAPESRTDQGQLAKQDQSPTHHQQTQRSSPQSHKRPLPKKEPSLHLDLAQLSNPAKRRELAHKLGQKNAFHLSLTYQDDKKAIHRLREALGKQGIGLQLDQSAQQQLRAKKPGVNYLVYADNLWPEELAMILQQLGMSGKGKDAPSPFETVVIGPLTPQHRKELARLLGAALQPAAKATEPDLPMALTGALIEAKSGQTSRRTGPTLKEPRRPERLALVMASDAREPGPQARAFLRQHPTPRPGTLQILLVLQPVRL
jgi:hypothetical protein